MKEKEALCNAPIGVFDSGVGGLTVAREIMRQLPNERIVYFGDTARVPYGSKSHDTITRYSRQIVRFLQTQDVKAIVIACNSASACALEALEAETELPIIDVVLVFWWQEQHFRLVLFHGRGRRFPVAHVPREGLHGFHEAEFPHFHQIVEGGEAAEAP